MNPAPLRLHDEDRPVEGHARNQAIIGGWPYSVAFESYVDREDWAALMNERPGRDPLTPRLPRSPLRETMKHLYNPRGSQCHEYRILHALVNKHADPETVRVLIGGCRQEFFEAAAMRAFALMWDGAQQVITKAGK